VYFDDPDSPGGKEYSIPHERTRRENGGSGGGGENPESLGETPRFGVGIDSGEDGAAGGAEDGSGGDGSGSGGGGSGGDGGGGDSGGSGSGDATGGTSAGSSGAGSGEVDYNATSSSSDTAPELTVSAIALGVLLAGAGLGLVLRRSRRDAS
jgi:hypothetical protein